LILALAGCPGAAIALSACGDDTVTSLPDAGSADATTYDVTTADVPLVPHEAAVEAGCTPVEAGPLDDAAVASGLALSMAYKCQKCHGDQLGGNPQGVQFSGDEGGLAYPPNLTPDPATGLGCWTDSQIQNAILDGIDDQGQPLCPPMPHFADAGLDASGVANLIELLRSLQPVVTHVPDTVCSFGPPPSDAGTDGADGSFDAADASDDGGEGGSPEASGD
jgi:hypothetical protein